MKRLTSYMIISLLGFFPLPAQNFLDNPHLQESRKLQAQAETYFEQGDYDTSIDLAQRAKAEAELSDLWVQKEIERYGAYNEKRRATDRVAVVQGFNRAPAYEQELQKAKEALDLSSAAYDEKEYVEAKNQATLVLEILANLKDGSLLPEFYVVRNLSLADCFWRIAAYPFVFGNPEFWPKLYEANKDKLRNPENPNLIHPGLRLVIPSINGETRQGDFDPRIQY